MNYKKKGVKVVVYGNGWPNGSLKPDDMIQVFKKSKINLNLSNSISWDLRYIISSPRSFISLVKLLLIKRGKDSSQIKARNFEIPFFGGFQLTDYVPALETYFNIGDEVICYTSPDDAFLQINHYLKDDTTREKIRSNGQLKAISQHGYLHRLKEILERIQ